MKLRVGLRAIAVTLAGCGLLAVLAARSSWPAAWFRDSLYSQLATAPAAELPLLIEKLRGLGELGTTALVDGLSHARPEVRDSCQQGLETQLADWRHLPAEQAEGLVIDLAEQLAARLPPGDADAMRRGLRLALRLLDWPLRGNRSRMAARTFACEQIVRAASELGIMREHAFSQQPVGSLVARRFPPGWDARTGSAAAAGPYAVAPPLTGADRPQPNGAPVYDTAIQNEPNLPQPSGDGAVAARPEETDPGREPLSDPDLPIPLEPARLEPLPQLPEPRELNLTPEQQEELGQAFAGLSNLDVIQLLADESQRRSALRELQRRGFGERELRVSLALAAPDEETREQLAQTLPQVSGLDPRPWLLILARDAAPRVRAAAVRWLATSTDPRIRSYLAELAEQETDLTVRQALRGTAITR